MQDKMRCTALLNEVLPSLSSKEKELAQFLLEHSERAAALSLNELAEQSGISVSTIIRLSKRLGYSGYKELSYRLASEQAYSEGEITYQDISPGDTPAVVMQNILLMNIHSLKNTMAVLKVDEMEKAVELVSKAARVDFYGVGNSGIVALDAATKFMRINKHVAAYTDLHTQLLSVQSLKSGDVAVLISYTGETYDILKLCAQIQKTGASIISITRSGKNALAQKADVRLFCSSAETMLRIGAMSSRIVQMSVVDVLFAAVCSRDYNELKSSLDNAHYAIRDMHPNVVFRETPAKPENTL